MMCDKCGTRDAKVAFNVLFDGKKIVRNYCLQCASMLNRGDALSIQMALINSLTAESMETAVVCPKCGTSVEAMQKSGRVGCAACYRAFGKATEELLKKLNGTERQIAETTLDMPQMTETQQRLRALRNEMAQAVSVENYERAAQLRDEINELSILAEEEARR